MSRIDNWESGLESEINYWRGEVDTHKGDPTKFDGSMEVNPHFRGVLVSASERLGKPLGRLKILDLGCGANDCMGGTCNGERLNITRADYLADTYNQLLKEVGVDYKIEFADMTNLKYKDKEFDVIHCGNAMDHCGDIHKAFQEITRVGKVVYTWHYRNVETLAPAGQKGLHRWNIDHDGESLVVWQPGGERVVIEGYRAYEDDDHCPTTKVIGVNETGLYFNTNSC
jgi:SAM-dependent methyltransferase